MEEQFDDIYLRRLSKSISFKPYNWPKSTSQMKVYVDYNKSQLNRPLDDKGTINSKISGINLTDHELSKKLYGD